MEWSSAYSSFLHGSNQFQENAVTESQGFLCDLCSEIFDAEIELKNHVKDEHKVLIVAEAYSPQPLPGTGGDSFDNVELPSPSHASQRIAKKTNKRRPVTLFCCDKCDYTTKVKASMKVHRLIHTLDCPYCDFKSVRQLNLKEHILSEHKHEMYLPDSRKHGVGVVSTSNRVVSSAGIKKGSGQQKFILGKIANQGLLNKLTLTSNMMTEEFSYIRDINKPSVIVNKETVETMNKALQFLTDHTKQVDELVEVEEENIEVIVPDYSVKGDVAVDDNHNDVFKWTIA